MGANTLIPVLTTAMTVGLGCGTCCSPVISIFLSTYVISHADGVKRGILSFASFFLGKAISVSIMCMIAAMIGRQFIEEEGYIGSFNLRLFAQIILSGIGFIMAVRWFKENKKKKSCQNCSCSQSEFKPASGFLPMFSAGITYGFTPCAPLLMMIGYSFTLPIAFAGLNGAVFSVSSAASPVLLLVIITGALSKKLKQEIPQYLRWFRLASYLLLMIMPFIIQNY